MLEHVPKYKVGDRVRIVRNMADVYPHRGYDKDWFKKEGIDFGEVVTMVSIQPLEGIQTLHKAETSNGKIITVYDEEIELEINACMGCRSRCADRSKICGFYQKEKVK